MGIVQRVVTKAKVKVLLTNGSLAHGIFKIFNTEELTNEMGIHMSTLVEENHGFIVIRDCCNKEMTSSDTALLLQSFVNLLQVQMVSFPCITWAKIPLRLTMDRDFSSKFGSICKACVPIDLGLPCSPCEMYVRLRVSGLGS